MKTKKQLEKEIEKLNNETDGCEKCILLRAKKLNNFCAIHDIDVAETEATFTQTNEIIKLIEEEIKKGQCPDCDKRTKDCKCSYRNLFVTMNRKKLLTKIKGDGE